jgi:hypothetical protein
LEKTPLSPLGVKRLYLAILKVKVEEHFPTQSHTSFVQDPILDMLKKIEFKNFSTLQ